MAQATKWLPAILDYMKKVKLNISTCLASFPTRTANYLLLNWNNLTLHTIRPALAINGIRPIVHMLSSAFD